MRSVEILEIFELDVFDCVADLTCMEFRIIVDMNKKAELCCAIARAKINLR